MDQQISGPWTAESGVLTSSTYNAVVNASAYWRCKVTCGLTSDTSAAVFSDVALLFQEEPILSIVLTLQEVEIIKHLPMRYLPFNVVSRVLLYLM
ncbi:MAG: hypothetical protein IPJ26_17505 [Bacteroidetes bacterium]|nr:hypothetical protein [Bacteroidota bacterium]